MKIAKVLCFEVDANGNTKTLNVKNADAVIEAVKNFIAGGMKDKLQFQIKKVKKQAVKTPAVAPKAPKEKSVECRECGGNDFQSRGIQTNGNGSYKRLWCKNCGAWNRVDV